MPRRTHASARGSAIIPMMAGSESGFCMLLQIESSFARWTPGTGTAEQRAALPLDVIGQSPAAGSRANA